MSEVAPQVYTRKDLATMFKYSYWKAMKVYAAIVKTIPKKDMKPEFKQRLPCHYVHDYMGKK